MYKHLFKFAVTSLTILTAELLASVITDRLVSYKWAINPLKFTLISMAIITIVFYPLFMKLEDWLNVFTKRFVRAGRSVAGKYLGLLLMYIVGITTLLYFYAQMWYHINIFSYLFQGN